MHVHVNLFFGVRLMVVKDGVEIQLKQILDSRGMKQEFLCKKTGITTKTMSSLCRGESLPSLKNSLKISKVLGLSVEEIWVLLEERE
jgi:putative transcriptional regulator